MILRVLLAGLSHRDTPFRKRKLKMLFIFVRCPLASAGHYNFERNLKFMNIKSFIAVAAALCFAIVSFGCGGAATNTSNTTANKSSNSTTVTNSSSTTTTAPANASAANTSASNTEAKNETASAVTGVPECDEYIQKYEACLTTIAAKAPQAEPGLKTAFEAQRNGFKAAASTPQGKAALAGQCKGFIETAKKSTAQWCTNW
jgi:hypothetical protein